MDPALLSAVFVALAGLGGVLIGVLLVYRGYSRNNILLFSALGTVVGFVMLFAYFESGLDKANGKSTSKASTRGYYNSFGLSITDEWLWFAVLALVVHMLVFNLGYGSLAYPIMAEILPRKIRTRGMTLIMFLGGFFGFANAKSFGDMEAAMGTSYTFLAYGMLNAVGALYLYFVIPPLP